MNGLADFENIFAWILDSKQDFNGFLGPPIYCSRLQIHLFFGQGFWTLRVIQNNIFAQISDSGQKWNGRFG